jgi:hypothetical protein
MDSATHETDADADARPRDTRDTDATEVGLDATAVNRDFSPVCGCDGVSYWNADQAAAHGVEVCGTNECPRAGAGPGACGSNIGKACPIGQTCVVDSPMYCGASDTVGRCWLIPPDATCPPDKDRYRDCATSACINYCQAVKTGQIVFPC